jgi:hypothetical protein
VSWSLSEWMQVISGLGGIATAVAVLVAVWTVRASERIQNGLLVQQHLFDYLRLYADTADLFVARKAYDREAYLALPGAERRRLDVLAVYRLYICDLLFQIRDSRASSYLKGFEILAGPLCEINMDAKSIRRPEVLNEWNRIRMSEGCPPIAEFTVNSHVGSSAKRAAQAAASD